MEVLVTLKDLIRKESGYIDEWLKLVEALRGTENIEEMEVLVTLKDLIRKESGYKDSLGTENIEEMEVLVTLKDLIRKESGYIDEWLKLVEALRGTENIEEMEVLVTLKAINSLKPKNKLWKKIMKIMPQRQCQEAWS
ncbi:hypothetical protein AgCh_020041 [Apium graveolens]